VKKFIFFCRFFAMMLGAGQVQAAQTGVAPASYNSPEVTGISYPSGAVQTAIRFDTSDVTVFGLSQVALAVLKMRIESRQMQAAYARLQKSPPALPSLRETFETRLNNDLGANGLHPEKVTIQRQSGADDEVTYTLPSGPGTPRWTVVVDRLAAIYYAPGPGEAYEPRASALITILDRSQKGSGVQEHFSSKVEQRTGGKGKHAFRDFTALEKNPADAHEGLRQILVQLADQVAATLISTRITGAGGTTRDKNTRSTGCYLPAHCR